MCRNFDRRILRNVTRRLFFAMLNQERTKTAEENVDLLVKTGAETPQKQENATL